MLRKPSKWFNKASGTKAWVVHRCFNGIPGSRPVAHQLTTTNTQGDPQVAQLLKLLHEFKSSSNQDRRWTIRDIAEEMEVGYGTYQRVLTEELGIHCVTAKFVPRILTADQKQQQRFNICTELRQFTSDGKTFLSRVISGDESWVYGYDLETKRQSSQWKSPTSPRPKKARQVKSNLKSMINTFFDIKGIVHKEFVPTGRTVNSRFYCEILWRLREKVRRHHPQLWREQTWLLHHDNARLTLPFSPTSFWQKAKLLSSPTHRTPPIWHPVTSSYFQKWNWSWKDAGSIPLRRSRPNRRECLKLWQKRTSRKRSKNGGDIGTGVYMREGTTSGVTATDRPYGEFYNFYRVSPENFGSTLICTCFPPLCLL